MNIETPEQIKAYENACLAVLELPKVRFVGIISNMGRLIAGKFKEGVKSYLDDKEDGMAYMQFAMEVFLREEYNDKLGEIDYVLSKRKKISVISIPKKKHLILISAEPDADVQMIFEESHKQFDPIM